MEKQIRVGEFIISLIILIGMGVAAWVNVKTSQAKQEVEIQVLKDANKKTADKQDEILNSINNLRLLIENKQDRENQSFSK